MRCLLIRFASLSLLSTSFMLTQDDLSAFYDEVDKLIDSGVSKEEIINYIGLGCQKPILIFDFACTLKI